ncbi:MAG: helix-turn-helix transcriptional regulator [Gammaproteobacteria bacterium]
MTDVVCDSGPHDRVFEEQHDSVNIAVVTQGTFQYRASHGSAVLVPGALLLGNHGACFECGHDHGHGDRCLAFHYSPDLFESVVAATPGAQRTAFSVPRLPPMSALSRLIAEGDAAREHGDAAQLEELALRMAGAVIELLGEAPRASRVSHPREERRISEALRSIEICADEILSLTRLARDAAMSPYHFLRVFRRVAGVTPHQFVLNRRLHRAAVSLRASQAPISSIAFDSGFADLSTFNRRFRRVMGVSPSTFRAEAQQLKPSGPFLESQITRDYG